MLHRNHREGAHRPYLRSELAFNFFEVFGWPPRTWLDDGHRDPRYKEATEVVDVDTVDGQSRTGKRRYYHPRPQWLEVMETGDHQ